jgi:hypothetical protein
VESESTARLWSIETFLRSSKNGEFATINPTQGLLFNEAEALAAIEAADQARGERTPAVEAHVRKHTGAHKPIPKYFPCFVMTHDLPEDQKICTKCPVPHALTRIGEDVRECYVFQPRKSVASSM